MSSRSFVRHVLILASGTAAAQAVPVLASPVLSRLFSPEAFGAFAIIVAMISALSPSCAGRFDVAIVFPLRQRDAQELAGLAFITVSFITLIVLLLIHLYSDLLLVTMNAVALSDWVYCVPLLLFLNGVWNIGNYLSNREQRYKLIAASRILKNSVMICVQIICGILGYQVGGLLAGFVAGWLLSLLLMGYQHRCYLVKNTVKLSPRKKLVAKQYKKYPLYDAPATLFNSATAQIPYFILPVFFSGEIVGQFYMMQRVLYVPLSFISLSVAQVNMKQASQILKNKGRLDLYVLKMAFLLFLIAVVPMTVIYFYADQLFVFVLGEQWMRAGHFAVILVPAIVIQFVAGALSTTLYATKHLRAIAVWKVLSFISTLFVFLYYAPRKNIDELLTALMINMMTLYAIYFLIIFIAAKKSNIVKIKK